MVSGLRPFALASGGAISPDQLEQN